MNLSGLDRLGILAAVEFGWEKFPSTKESSLGLTFAHVFMLLGVYYGQVTGVGGYAGSEQARVASSAASPSKRKKPRKVE